MWLSDIYRATLSSFVFVFILILFYIGNPIHLLPDEGLSWTEAVNLYLKLGNKSMKKKKYLIFVKEISSFLPTCFSKYCHIQYHPVQLQPISRPAQCILQTESSHHSQLYWQTDRALALNHILGKCRKKATYLTDPVY